MAVVRRISVAAQRRFATKIDSILRRYRKNRSVYRQMNNIRLQIFFALYGGEVYDDFPEAAALAGALQSRDERCELFQLFISTRSNNESTVLLHAQFACMANASLLASDTPNYFRVCEPLMALLQATELRGVLPEDVRMPFPGLFIEIPKGWFCWRDDTTGYHPVEMIGLYLQGAGSAPKITTAEGKNGESVEWLIGRRLLVVVYGSANDQSCGPDDDGCGFFSIPLHTQGVPIETLFTTEQDCADKVLEQDPQGGMVGTARVSGREIRNAMRIFVLNFLLYLSTSDPDLKHIHADKIESLVKQRKHKGKNFAKNRIRDLESDRTMIVGSRVYVRKDQLDYGLSGGAYGDRRSQSFRSLVRGHWRSQAHGPKHTLRKVIWIRPHTRGGEADQVLGHEYVLK